MDADPHHKSGLAGAAVGCRLNPIGISVVRTNDSITFEFSRPVSFDFFVISNSDENVFWELRPVALTRGPILSSDMFGIDLGGQAQDFGEALQQLAEESEPHALRGVDVVRVVYGRTPEGYREEQRALPLQTGEKYCVLVFGDGLVKGTDYFVL